MCRQSMNLNGAVIWSTTLTNLTALYPIYGLLAIGYYFGVFIVTLSMLASSIHHISHTSLSRGVKGLYFGKYSAIFLRADILCAVATIIYAVNLFFMDPVVSKLYVPIGGFICLIISVSILPDTEISNAYAPVIILIPGVNRIISIYCEITKVMYGRLSHRTKLIIFAITHNIWHITGFYGVACMIPSQ